MSNDDSTNLLLTGALFAGAGVVGFLGARRFAGDRPRPSAPTEPAPAPSTLPALPPPSVPSAVGTSNPPGEPAATETPPSGLSRRFDPIFDRHRGTIPIEFMRALATRESGMNPGSKGRAAWGLLQIIEVVRADFNTAHTTSVARDQLLDPEVNVRIASWLLHRIVKSYERHADLPNLRTDWSNPRFVELVVFGWNAGWSRTGGVGRVLEWLKAKGARDVDIDLIHENARSAGAVKHLSNAAKVRWCKSVVALYEQERAFAAGPVTTPNA